MPHASRMQIVWYLHQLHSCCRCQDVKREFGNITNKVANVCVYQAGAQLLLRYKMQRPASDHLQYSPYCGSCCHLLPYKEVQFRNSESSLCHERTAMHQLPSRGELMPTPEERTRRASVGLMLVQ